MTQDVFLRAWTELPRLRDADRFEAWLRRILVNRCRDVGRSRGRALAVLSPSPAPVQGSVADGTGQLDDSADLSAALARLTVDQRAVLALHYAADLTLPGVAAALGVPVGTAKSRLNAALARLRVELGPER